MHQESGEVGLGPAMSSIGEDMSRHFTSIFQFESKIAQSIEELDEFHRNSKRLKDKITTKTRELETKQTYIEARRSAFEHESNQTRLVLERNITGMQNLLEELECESERLITKSDTLTAAMNGANVTFTQIDDIHQGVDRRRDIVANLSLALKAIETSEEVARLQSEIDMEKDKIEGVREKIETVELRIGELDERLLERPSLVLSSERHERIIRCLEYRRNIDRVMAKIQSIDKADTKIRQAIRSAQEVVGCKRTRIETVRGSICRIERRVPSPEVHRHPLYREVLAKKARSRNRIERVGLQIKRMKKQEQELKEAKKRLMEKEAQEEQCDILISALESKVETRFERAERRVTEDECTYNGLKRTIALRKEESIMLNSSLATETSDDDVSVVPRRAVSEHRLIRLSDKLARALGENRRLAKMYRKVKRAGKHVMYEIEAMGERLQNIARSSQMKIITHNDNVSQLYEFKTTIPDMNDQLHSRLKSVIAEKRDHIRERKRVMMKRLDVVADIVQEYGLWGSHGTCIIESCKKG